MNWITESESLHHTMRSVCKFNLMIQEFPGSVGQDLHVGVYLWWVAQVEGWQIFQFWQVLSCEVSIHRFFMWRFQSIHSLLRLFQLIGSTLWNKLLFLAVYWTTGLAKLLWVFSPVVMINWVRWQQCYFDVVMGLMLHIIAVAESTHIAMQTICVFTCLMH